MSLRNGVFSWVESHGHRPGDVGDNKQRHYQRHLLKKVKTFHSWHWNQSHVIPMEASRRTKIEKSMTNSNVKALLIVFFDCNGVMHHEFLPQGRTINKEYYVEVRGRLHEANRQKFCAFEKTNHGFCTVIMHQLTHRCWCVSFLQKNKTIITPQPSDFTEFGLRWIFFPSNKGCVC